MRIRPPLSTLGLAGIVLAVAGVITAAFVFHPNLTPVERGRRLAAENGCFGCHGPEGTSGTANPGRKDGKVPTFSGTLMMYANDAEDVRAWIANGATKEKAASETWKEERKKGALRMPAFGKRLSAREIDDLVAFVMAAAEMSAPDDSLALAGRDRAEELGCFGCHGAGGRYERSNRGSLKGYVPAWDGADFPDLVRDRAEFGEWVENGAPQRLRSNPLAMYFLRKASLHMPGFRAHLEPGDVDAIWAYVSWLRSRQPVVLQ
ncbi:MAG: c-type cytochrome [Hyphomicrobiales bacterium]